MHSRLRILLAVAASAAIAAGAAVAQSTGSGAQSGGPQAAASGDNAKQMHEHMMKGMQKMQSMPMTGNMDKDFATMMREHHVQGVQMAKMELQHGKSLEMKRMAEKIIKDQQKEIAQFDKWLATQK